LRHLKCEASQQSEETCREHRGSISKTQAKKAFRSILFKIHFLQTNKQKSASQRTAARIAPKWTQMSLKWKTWSVKQAEMRQEQMAFKTWWSTSKKTQMQTTAKSLRAPLLISDFPRTESWIRRPECAKSI